MCRQCWKRASIGSGNCALRAWHYPIRTHHLPARGKRRHTPSQICIFMHAQAPHTHACQRTHVYACVHAASREFSTNYACVAKINFSHATYEEAEEQYEFNSLELAKTRTDAHTYTHISQCLNWYRDMIIIHTYTHISQCLNRYGDMIIIHTHTRTYMLARTHIRDAYSHTNYHRRSF